MLYRFTQSSHPRSGFIGCITFVIISLDTYTAQGEPSVITIAWTRGLAFVVGIIAAVTVNWVLWPFIARHELRKSISIMMLHSAILYRGVIAKYVYPTADTKPGPQDVERSEMLEGRLREGFVRMRQLLEMTRHEIVRSRRLAKQGPGLLTLTAPPCTIQPGSILLPHNEPGISLRTSRSTPPIKSPLPT